MAILSIAIAALDTLRAEMEQALLALNQHDRNLPFIQVTRVLDALWPLITQALAARPATGETPPQDDSESFSQHAAELLDWFERDYGTQGEIGLIEVRRWLETRPIHRTMRPAPARGAQP